MTKKVTSLKEFMELPVVQQYDLLHRDGAYVGKRSVGSHTAVLLQLYGFYVEVIYKIYRKDIVELRCSNETDLLVPYLGQIHVRDLPPEGKQDGKDEQSAV
ncbi:hypothetical protein [Flaviaesturariibacter amylovorans]|uniref:Uncharacterized protein n=1 Tax=Flaviaesturariibacter amylovorans TaxID=1084520 RepID=A0ABP8H4Z5_9BACT